MQRRPRSRLIAVALLGLLGSAVVESRAEPEAATETAAPNFSAELLKFFEKEIRPLLVERCWKCHSAAKQQGNLRLDSRAGVLAGGDLGSAASPGDADASLLVEVVGYAGDIRMPPSGKLSEREVAAIQRWVREGLPWPQDRAVPAPAGEAKELSSARPIPWSFAPVTDPTPPQVQQPDWCREPLDRFILARLEAAGLSPAPATDKRTLIRRAKFDLLGLPPTSAEVEAFVADDTPDAFARLVDRYLAAPEYGQRWGRHWLDVARYADSNGQDENLAYVNAFRYRDYVVDAFNSDKPYDQFLREQIAGDLLPDESSSSATTEDSATRDQQRFARTVATGFLTLGPKMLAEDDPVKMEMDIVDEQLDTLGAAFLGLTLGCARCHDHKFDPISTADYYALAGIFKSTRTMDNFKVVAQWHERPLGTAAEIAAIAAHAERVSAKQSEIAAHVQQANAALVESVQQRLADYLLAATDLLAAPPLESLLQGSPQRPAMTPPEGTIFLEAEQFARGNVLVDTTAYGAGIGVILNRGELPNFVEYDVEIPRAGWYQFEVRYAAAESRSVQVLVDGKVRKADAAADVTGSWNAESQRWMPEGVWQLSAGKLVLRIERTAGPIPHLDRIALIPVGVDGAAGPLVATSADELAVARGLQAPFVKQWAEYLKRERDLPDSVWRFWFEFAPAQEVESTALPSTAGQVAAKLLENGRPATREALAARYQATLQALAADGTMPPAATAEAALRQVLDPERGPQKLVSRPEALYAATDRQRLEDLNRELGALEQAAPPALPQAMAVEEGAPTDLKIHIRGSHLTLGDLVPRRFPQALASRSEALATPGSGRLELAQWMASAEHPLTSRVLVNRLWRWHFGAGLVRSTDNFGNLGDPPSHPELLDWLARRFVESGWSIKAMHRLIMNSAVYQGSTRYDARAAEVDPDNRLLWRMNRRRLEAEAVRDALLFVGGQLDTSLGGTLLKNKPREYVAGTASVNSTNYATNRRSLYLPVVRSALYEPFQAFDFAEPTTIKGDRDSTTIASQALFMMNSEIVNEQSSRLAAQLLAGHANDPAARVGELYGMTLGRAPQQAETARALSFVGRYQASLESGDAPAREASAWQALCRVILSSNEFLYVE
ncbi:MAG: DUF1553 domain-containing protein [Planctomycetaceae bacterium]|nr:DUF1553 domain-containing protein [Planctomycetaceae bacterium]